jgi:transcription antitermination protein NusB
MGFPRPSFPARRSAARLAAVQALYTLEVSGGGVDAVLADFLGRAWPPADSAEEGGQGAEPDAGYLQTLVAGVTEHRDVLDAAIDDTLSHGWTFARLEILLQAILRTGAYELFALPDVPAKVVINEHLEIAHAFFAGKEPSLVNAVLDRLAVRFRGDDAAQRGRSTDGDA